jgi:hypothetical protein
MMEKSLLIALALLIVSLPCGYWRAGTRKFSPAWFAAVHSPIPLAIGLRWSLGMPFRWATFPLYLAAVIGGQLLGGRLRSRQARD